MQRAGHGRVADWCLLLGVAAAGESGNLGLGDRAHRSVPTKVPLAHDAATVGSTTLPTLSSF